MELAKQTGFEDNYEVINLHYGQFAKMVGEKIGFEPTQKINNKPVWTFVLCDDTYDQFGKKTQEWTWTLKKNVVNAIRFLGWFE
jgi:putative restriction endonuclease